MSEFLAVLEFSLSVTGPIFIIIALGVWLMRIGVIDSAFVESGSRLVFNVALPALLFISISQTRFERAANVELILFGLVATLLVYLLLEWLAGRWVEPPEDRGVVVQGGFRSNMGIIGLAYCVNAYGEDGLAAASLYLGLVTIAYNVLAVITLNRSLDANRSVGKVLKGIATNPLIIGIVLALPVSWAAIPMPELVIKSGQYFANLTLPLALLCTGASLNFKRLREEMRNTVFTAVVKLIAVPVIFVLAGRLLGFRGIDMGVLLLMSGAPTSAASYVMVRAMGGNATLAANIIVLTTLGSIFTASVGITLLRSIGWM